MIGEGSPEKQERPKKEQKQGKGKGRGFGAPSVSQILKDEFSKDADNWSKPATQTVFKPELVEKIYSSVKAGGFQPSRIMVLEFSCYLENYLWPFFEAGTA